MRITQEIYVDTKNVGQQNTRQAYIVYLQRTEWTHICTLTFKTPVSANTAWHRLKEWLSIIRVRYKREVSWFAVVEVGEERERHIHALLQVSPIVTCDALRSQWPAGISHIQRFDPDKPGIYYLTKTLNRDDAEFDLEIIANEGRKNAQMKKPMQKGETSEVDQLITVEEASRTLRITKARCYDLIRRQMLPAVSLGRQRRISERALKRFIRKGGKGLS